MECYEYDAASWIPSERNVHPYLEECLQFAKMLIMQKSLNTIIKNKQNFDPYLEVNTIPDRNRRDRRVEMKKNEENEDDCVKQNIPRDLKQNK